MTNYFEPDDRWEIFGAKSYEGYLSKFVPKCHFHKNVPEDILKDFETVQQLFAHSYYHYPMYDEGFKKLLGMTEMAVKMRCKQLGIPLTYLNDKGKAQRKVLNLLMTDLHKEESIKGLENDFIKIRTIRNYFAHPERHGFFGSMVYLSSLQIINTINSIFQQTTPFAQSQKELLKINNQRKQWENGCFVLTYNDTNYLIWGTNCIETWCLNNEWISLWVIHPVVTNITGELENQRYTPPLYLRLKKLNFTDIAFEAIDLTTSQPIRIIHTNKEENVSRVNQFLTDLNQANKEYSIFYTMFLDNKLADELVKHRYEHYWDQNINQ